jgi:hypothetical protein
MVECGPGDIFPFFHPQRQYFFGEGRVSPGGATFGSFSNAQRCSKIPKDFSNSRGETKLLCVCSSSKNSAEKGDTAAIYIQANQFSPFFKKLRLMRKKL